MRKLSLILVIGLCACNNPAQEGAKTYFDAALAKNQDAELDAAVRSLAPTLQCQHLAREIDALRSQSDYKATATALARIKASAKGQGCLS